MKKLGFTVSEVMVALSMIGIIAALTIPTFITESRARANAAKLGPTISAVENAFTSMMATEMRDNLKDTQWGIAAANNDIANSTNLLGNYLRLAGGTDNITDFYDNANPFLTIDRVAWAEFPDNWDYIYNTKSGALMFFRYDNDVQDEATVATLGGSLNEKIGTLIIDVNGRLNPNQYGRDVFHFTIGSNGVLYPWGSYNHSIIEGNTGSVNAARAQTYNQENSMFICTDATKGLGCTARLIENNYDIDY